MTKVRIPRFFIVSRLAEFTGKKIIVTEMKKAFLLLLIVASNVMAEESVVDYFYKSERNLFCFLPESEHPRDMEITFGQLGWDAIIQQIIRFGNLGASRAIYGYELVGNSVVSYAQWYTDIFGGETRWKDQLTILTIPEEKSSWTENDRGGVYKCKSEWVYIAYRTNNGRDVVNKAIKMSKAITLNSSKKTYTQYSYWSKGDGHIASYEYDNISKKIIVNELRTFITPSVRIKEVSEKEYTAYLEEKARQEEIARKAKEEKNYNEFVANLKPQRLSIANHAAFDSISKLFGDLEKIRYANQIETGVYNSLILSDLSGADEQTKLYVDFPLESELFVDAPEEERDTIISYILNLMRDGIIQDAYVTEPTTKRKCAVGQWLSTSIDVNIERLSFDVVRSKDTWKMADKKAIMSQAYSSYIIQAANNVLANNKKAKKQKVDLMILKFNNEQKGIWHIQVNPANNSSFNYTMLD